MKEQGEIVGGTKFTMWKCQRPASEETLMEPMLKLRSVRGLSYLKADNGEN